jgi:putative nucleotidyltransferase with HDIG domain
MERVNSEFIRILKSGKAADSIRELHRTGLLSYILPEFDEAWGFNQNSHYHSMNLTDHSLAVMENIGKTGATYRMAALLHDISKYRNWQVKDNGEFGYQGHDKESAKLAVSILKRLKWSGEDIAKVEKMISCHMILKPYRDPVTGLYNGSAKITRRIARELGNEIGECLSLINADNISHAPAYNMPSQITSFYNALSKLGKVPIVRSCPVSGELIMETFNLKPGPVIGEIKEIMLEWLDENPSLDSEQLVKMFGEEYGGKGFWVWKDYSGFFNITFSEPVIGSDGEITTKPFEIPYQIETEGRVLDGWKEWWNAIEHPKIYSAVNRSKKARAIFSEAAKVLFKLEDIPGFKQVKMEIDSYNDLSGTIEWKDLKPDYIL